MAKPLNASAPLIQGIAAPNYVVDKQFYAATRRLRFPMRTAVAIGGLGLTDSVQLRQTGIVDALELRVFGSLTFGGTIGTTTMSWDWPFNIIQQLKLSANGQSNLMSARGLTLRALEIVSNAKVDDSGLDRTMGGATVNTGTLAYPTDDWGSGLTLGPGSNVSAIGTYTVDLAFLVPVAIDHVWLLGSVFAQSSATNLTLDIQWATQAQILSALGGAATFSAALSWEVTGVAYSIPNVNGAFLVPDLSMFHQVAETRVSPGVGQGANEHLLTGTGVGRRLARVVSQVISNAAPLAVNATNYGKIGWAYGGSDTPETYVSGQAHRVAAYRVAGADLGGRWGLMLHDFISQNAVRDLVDEATTSDLRIFEELLGAPTTPSIFIAQETLFAAPVGA